MKAAERDGYSAGYSAGYRDGFSAARERCTAETALLRATLDSLVERFAALTPPAPILVSAAEAERLVQLGMRMVDSK